MSFEIKLKKIFSLVGLIISSFRWGKIGKLCYILPPTYISNRSKIFLGNNVHINHSFRCEVYEPGIITIGNNVSIGHNCHVTVKGNLSIGSECIISSNVFLGSLDHDLSEIKLKALRKGKLIGKETKIGSNCFIGTGAIILPGSTINNNSIIGAGAIVKGSYPENSILISPKAESYKK